MSIADKISALNDAKNDIASAIESKGGTVTGGFSTFAEDIASIPSGGGSVLPSAYQQVEYIESTGTQYIEAPYKPLATDMIISEFNLTSRVRYACFFGSLGYYLRSSSSSSSYTAYFENGSYRKVGTMNVKTIIKTGGDICIFYGNETVDDYNDIKESGIGYSYKADSFSMTLADTTDNIYVFNYNGSMTHAITPCKCYGFKAYDSSGVSLKLNLIPCYRKVDDVVGMYDTVSQTFFTNKGTGTFLKGADV